jgi:hypothetical protein
MKKLFVAVCLCFCGHHLFAQQSIVEAEIRANEQREVQAILARDTIVLKQLWDKDFIVHNPESKIVLAKPNSVDRPVLQNQRTSFTRVVEKIMINGDVVISMGRETVVSTNETSASEQTVERRYTNIWMKKGGSWKLVARHANRICK